MKIDLDELDRKTMLFDPLMKQMEYMGDFFDWHLTTINKTLTTDKLIEEFLEEVAHNFIPITGYILEEGSYLRADCPMCHDKKLNIKLSDGVFHCSKCEDVSGVFVNRFLDMQKPSKANSSKN